MSTTKFGLTVQLMSHASPIRLTTLSIAHIDLNDFHVSPPNFTNMVGIKIYYKEDKEDADNVFRAASVPKPPRGLLGYSSRSTTLVSLSIFTQTKE